MSTPSPAIHEFEITAEEAHERLDVVLARRLDLSRAQTRRLLEEGGVSLDGSPVVVGPANRRWLASYLTPSIKAIGDEAQAELNRRRVAPFEELRFTAVHHYATNSRMPSSDGQPSSYGQFSIAGPIANSLVPLPDGLRTWPVSPAGDQKLLRLVSMVPFFSVFLTSGGEVGLNWLSPVKVLQTTTNRPSPFMATCGLSSFVLGCVLMRNSPPFGLPSALYRWP